MDKVRIVMGDPGRHNDPFGIVGVQVDMGTGIIRPLLARQFIKTKYGVVADYMLMVKNKIKPHFIGIETNNRGKKVQQLFKQKYNLDVAGVFTSANLTEKTINRGYSMDKPEMVRWLKDAMANHQVIFPEKPSEDMQELINQIHQIVGITGPSGHTTYKAMRGRHDDLFMAFLLCCHVTILFMKRQEMIS